MKLIWKNTTSKMLLHWVMFQIKQSHYGKFIQTIAIFGGIWKKRIGVLSMTSMIALESFTY
ncbi:MAG: hypothetical protein CBC05_01745 [Crocinitomicaceae bacterium TMED45]|nr:MAG: hypothetical protein CBC05_01745 [Crocinitomicaceae bacterium TMED45]